MMLFLHSAVLILAFAGLTHTAKLIVESSVNIASRLRVSLTIIGVFIIGFGSSLPELIVSVTSVVNEKDLPMAVGNAIGSNTVNITLIIGACYLLRNFHFARKDIKSHIPPVVAACTLPGILLLDFEFTRLDSVILFIGLAVCLYWITRGAPGGAPGTGMKTSETPTSSHSAYSTQKSFVIVTLSMVGLIISAQLAVWAAVHIAFALNVGTDIIALTILAIGTSLPELTAAIVSVLSRQPLLAIGNVMGSLIFNSLAINGASSLIYPNAVPEMMLFRDTTVMLAVTLLYSLFLLTPPRFNILKGLVLLLIFCTYETILYLI